MAFASALTSNCLSICLLQPWNEQPARNKASFEERPIFWLLDGHYSHQFADAMDYLAAHDVHVFFTAAGSSEIDQVSLCVCLCVCLCDCQSDPLLVLIQVADCGVMAHLQSQFGQAITNWYATNPGIPFLPAAWNVVYMQATQHLLTKGGGAILSAWKKTGWQVRWLCVCLCVCVCDSVCAVCVLFVQPFNPMAENYAREVYAASTFMDPRGGERLRADAQEGVQMLRQVEGNRAVLLRSRGANKGLLLRAAAVDFFNRSTVTPARESRQLYEQIVQGKASRVAVEDPAATDGVAALEERSNTASGAWGTAAEFRANRHAALGKRKAKVAKQTAAKAAREAKARLRVVEACAALPGVEAKLAAGGGLASLTVAELKSFIIGRGGKVPTGNKDACVARAEAVREQQPVVAVAAASQEVTALRAQVAAAEEEEEEEEEAEDEAEAAAATTAMEMEQAVACL